MKDAILIIGGARSGKSRFALELAEKTAPGEKIFLATCVPTDLEMRDRISRHQRDRKPHWKTFEIPLHIAAAISEPHRKAGAILVDCLTLWTNNLLSKTVDEDEIERYIQGLVEAVEKAPCPVFFVANEVGTGIVPENRLARLFRDVAGRVNQQIAAACTRVFWMVAGIPVPVKTPDIP